MNKELNYYCRTCKEYVEVDLKEEFEEGDWQPFCMKCDSKVEWSPWIENEREQQK